MLTEKQLKIFEPLTKNILKEYSIKEIKEACNEKSNNALSLALKKFKKENLLIERKVGRSLLYTLNLNNDLVFNYITILNNKKLPKLALKSIEKVKESVKEYTSFFSIVLFGSYAIEKQTKESDLDIAIFIKEKEKQKEIELAMKSLKLKIPVKIHSNIIPEKEFLEMLKTDYENLGKQIARKHLPIYNTSIFYSLLKRGIKNGFKF